MISTIDMTSAVDVDLDHVAEIVFVRFPYSTYSLPPLFPSVNSLEGSHYMQPYLEKGELGLSEGRVST